MKLSATLRRLTDSATAKATPDRLPLRGELFTLDHLQSHAKALAAEHRIDATANPEPSRLLERLEKNEAILRQFNVSTVEGGRKRPITPAAEWLLDNSYLLNEQIILARRHLPRRYSRQLPRLASGELAGLPRVYDLALELIWHTDGRCTIDNVSAFVAAYQTGQELTLGELWAVPIMLRLALLENVSRIAQGLLEARQHRDLADTWADRMAETAEKSPSDLIIIISELARSNPPLSRSFVSELWRRLHALGVSMQMARHWLDQRLTDGGHNLEEVIHAESQMQAADQVSVGNSITSLRAIGAADWREFVETLSVVEQTLRGDPAAIYAGMDFASRDRYRHMVEEIARYGQMSEPEAARAAISLAQAAVSGASEGRALAGEGAPRETHVGYYLVDRGLERLRSLARERLPGRLRFRRAVRARPLGSYLWAIVLLTLLPAAWLLFPAEEAGLTGWRLALFALLPVVCLSQLAVSVVNWLVALFLEPRLLPRMDFSNGIPPSCRTVVVSPMMLSGARAIDTMLERLELHYLGNRDKNLRFALLTDFVDASQASTLADEALLRRIRDGVGLLNEKYKADRPNIFFLFHRSRQWNEKEGVWMGWERKRGKLAEFNALLRGGSPDRFSDMVGDVALLRGAKYVITLDSDTQLPREAARRLVGTMAHPLNRPRFDAARRRIVEGYAILQPRVAVSLPSASRSWFVRLFAGDPGIDPYTRAVSDVYQDLFAEGSFIGKGIYDVEAFEQAVEGHFPENRILSHDLIESAHARSALVTDVELYEDYPSRYIADAHRRHRWIRGDWQIAPWLLPRTPGPDARKIQNTLSGLSKWKIFDNLRRSLVPVALTCLLIAGWLGHCGPAGFWTLFVALIVTAPGLLAALADAARSSPETPWLLHLRGVRDDLIRQMGFALFTLFFLPYDAFISADAIGRTVARVLVTHRRLLEWRTASEVETRSESSLASFLRTMWMAPALALALAACLAWNRPGEIGSAAVILLLWAMSPVIAWRISLPIRPASADLSAAQLALLKRTARKTWRFFELFVNEEENWLPPDNFQEHPVAVVASRTSPTNLGLGLLSSLAACDFGYITPGQLLERTTHAFGSLDQMERHRGHFYNWYDTRTLKPMLPFYISSVDSGNFAAHLLTFRQGLLELAQLPAANGVGLSGLEHTVMVLRETAVAANAPNAIRQVRAIDEKLRLALAHPPPNPAALAALLEKFGAMAAELARFATESQSQDLIWWSEALAGACQAQGRELELLTPWVSLPPMPAALQGMATQPQGKRLNEFSGMLSVLQSFPTLRQAARFEHTLLPLVALAAERMRLEKADGPNLAWLEELRGRVAEAGRRAAQRGREVESLAQRCLDYAKMDFTFLFDKSRELFSIGFNASDHRMDSSYYDLLASEARLTSYLAISQYQVEQEHWFNLSRILVSPDGAPVLVSWSGSMFEYLMPLLVMPTYENTLLDNTYKAAVERQIEYGRERSVPWGFSESGFNLTDAQLNYQYRAFGAPGLGLKRGLSEDLVVAPYATVMALMVAPAAACVNLERLAREGREGACGFYEAVDYTPSRLQPGQKSATVRSWMAHHQGMSLVALAYALLDKPMQRRFNSDPLFKSAELLLQERVPKVISPLRPAEEEQSGRPEAEETRKEALRVITNPNTPMPEAHLLSNGRYHVMVSASGGGYSRWRDLALTRWREDTTRDCWGNFCYLRDLDSGSVWSTAHQPTLRVSRFYEAIFTQGRAEFRRRLEDLDVHTEICVSPEDDVELRRLTLINHSDRSRTIEVTTYAEVALNAPAADMAHPAFSKLFVQTEILPEHKGVLCLRRPRSPKDKSPCFFHFVVTGEHDAGIVSYETDRAKFLGRERSAAAPLALQENGPLSNSQGAPLDPIVAIRRVIKLGPDETVRIDALFGVHETRDGAVALMQKYGDPHLTGRIIELAWTNSQVILHQLNITEADAQIFGRLAGSLLYPSRFRRAPGRVLQQNNRSQANLWAYGIAGDSPLVLVQLTDGSRMDFARSVIQAHAYWRLKGLVCDLVFLTEEDSVYRAALYDQVVGLVSASAGVSLLDRPGGIFVRRFDQIPEGDRILLQTVARVVLSDSEGTLAEQVGRRLRPETVVPQLIPSRRVENESVQTPAAPPAKAQLFNGYGGFSADGREYVISQRPGQATPAPWVNVLANPRLGTVISESGGAYTWAENAHEFRLTPWWNDPVSDTSGEAIYLRDDETGEVWSPTPGPAPSGQPFTIRHGFGYSVFSHTAHGIQSELTVFVDSDAPVKLSWLKLRNAGRRARKISVVGYWEWVLGELREKTGMHVTTEVDARSGALLARNSYNGDFSGRVAFADVQTPHRQYTCDRAEFLGRNGSPSAPDALKRLRLSGRTGPGLDPCAALQVTLELLEGQRREVVFTLGAGRDFGETQELIQRFRGTEAAAAALDRVKAFWARALGAVQIETPEPAVNLLANGWLTYQVLACRMWGRSGFYQSGGAYGFRDQLQDAMALLHCEPRLLRDHLLRAAAHQFVEGDVQHWWHPPTDRGVRTHFSDDFLFLPFAVCRYVLSVNDTGVLDEVIPFLEDRPLKPEEEAYYDLPRRSGVSAPLYEHCVRAINHGLSFGVHGLPLIGCGDWNDGMNLVGEYGKGESVWLAFFLYDVLTRFAEVARLRKDEAFARRCLDHARDLRQNIEKNAWDGGWYRRAYFDDGTPLGSAQNAECQIDSLPQSWAVISGAGDPERVRRAMNAVDQRLVKRDAGLIQLFDPPFDKSALNPGYIKGYLPGVRENGAQYTHAAVWTVLGFAMLGDAEKAWELLAMILPVNHSLNMAAADVYGVEPYVVAADVYTVPPHTGRGGWTWYTGSAGWLYRLIIEHLVGLKLEVDHLRFSPCLPAAWKTVAVHYRYRNSTYHVRLRARNGWKGVQQIMIDGQKQDGETLPLRDDEKEHQVEVIFG